MKGVGAKGALYLVRSFGLFLIFLSFGLYAQLVPLTLVFVGGMVGIGADADIVTTNGVVWVLSSLVLLAPMVYFFIRWVQYLWMRLVLRPTLSIPRAWSRSEKHT